MKGNLFCVCLSILKFQLFVCKILKSNLIRENLIFKTLIYKLKEFFFPNNAG